MKFAKILQALGIACVMIGLVQGIYGDMWGELYLLIAGIVVFYAGRIIEKRKEKSAVPQSSASAESAAADKSNP
jgi:hypothetical protein